MNMETKTRKLEPHWYETNLERVSVSRMKGHGLSLGTATHNLDDGVNILEVFVQSYMPPVRNSEWETA